VFSDQIRKQESDIVTTKLTNELSQSCIMAFGDRASPFRVHGQ
jgi:hypothetical protein